ncbi:MAG: hypothetical protein ACE5GJ_08610 [Gemmatimonadota bacterium]
MAGPPHPEGSGRADGVPPAASILLLTREAGGALIEVNPEATPLSSDARASLRGTAAELLPRLLEEGPAPR